MNFYKLNFIGFMDFYVFRFLVHILFIMISLIFIKPMILSLSLELKSQSYRYNINKIIYYKEYYD